MMEKSAYTMATLGLDTKDGQPKRDCGFYMKYFFLFLSLIQFLIILGLVLFMIYSNPLEGTEKHLKGLTNQLQESDKKIKALNEDIGKLKRQLNTTEKEGRLLQTQMLRLNTTLRLCNNEKIKLKEQQLINAAALSAANENKFNLQLLNITCVAQVSSLEKRLVATELTSQMERGSLSRDSKSWQDKAETAEKEKNECHLDKLQLQTREQKYQELKSTVVQQLEPALQNLRTSGDQFLNSYEGRGCYRSEVENTFRSLFRNLQTHLDSVGQQLDQKASEVTRENALLQSQKAACKQNLEKQDQQISLQQQQFEWQKQALQEAQESQIQKIRGEYRQMHDETESLKLQLQQTKQACISLRTSAPGNTALRNPLSLGPPNSFGTFPRSLGSIGSLGNPIGGAASSNAFSNPNLWGRPSSPAQPSSGSQRNLSTAEQNKLQEILKAAAETGKLSNVAPVNPVGQPKS
ncbi:plasmalemma vesicle-associated protein [Protobothrops mucrosquamatus]|uniref:plasmalemma vesicle-associated protein n=1 Tax=Protobothrops mucrosquamatus TaxID=103944 RepID=UPI000775A08D|nr:plasmalemma vesicle-associated protein [Protobothrops mucrosquamatus]